ncbi:Cro/CI family transcriptional regulator [Ewingella sp. CoE-038-23]|uniref:Cro/CI family transcriptional regulator n=2 Tax=Ewingella TaxID=41201 RepID=UPI0033656D04
MTSMTLKDYVAEHGQVRTGNALGVTQIAISKALQSGRTIHVSVKENGVLEAYEVKTFPSKRGPRSKSNGS